MNCFSPNWDMDKDFAKALVEAENNGVTVESYAFEVNSKGIFGLRPIPVNTRGVREV